MEKEIWVDVFNYEGYYQVSNTNKIRSVDREVNCKNGKKRVSKGVEKALTQRSGYWMVQLSKENSVTSFCMHRLLAQHFIPNPENKECVNHKNGIRLDNELKNLEWCTYSENHVHALNTGLYVPRSGENHPHSFLSNEDVINMRNMYDSKTKRISEISKEYNVQYKSVENIVKRRNWVNI